MHSIDHFIYSFKYIYNTNIMGRPRQSVAAICSANGFNKFGTPQLNKELLQVW